LKVNGFPHQARVVDIYFQQALDLRQKHFCEKGYFLPAWVWRGQGVFVKNESL
jgi:hypothetical protein